MPPTERDREKSRTVVRALMKASGATTQEEYASRLHVRPEQVSDWLRGENIPSGRRLIQMIELAGWLEQITDGRDDDPEVLLEQADQALRRVLPLLRAARER